MPRFFSSTVWASWYHGRMPSNSVVVITHTSGTRLGWLFDYLKHRWGNVLVHRAYSDELPDPEILRHPVVIMGGPMGVGDIPTLPWLAQEARWISNLLEKEHPMLGICLGAQLMAHSLGHTVRSCEDGTMECGYYPTQSEELPSHVYHWHQDGIYITSKGCQKLRCLGRSQWKQGQTTQGFVRGKAMGVQFHPEVDEYIITSWLAKDCTHPLRPYARPSYTHISDHLSFGPQQKQWLSSRLDQLWA